MNEFVKERVGKYREAESIGKQVRLLLTDEALEGKIVIPEPSLDEIFMAQELIGRNLALGATCIMGLDLISSRLAGLLKEKGSGLMDEMMHSLMDSTLKENGGMAKTVIGYSKTLVPQIMAAIGPWKASEYSDYFQNMDKTEEGRDTYLRLSFQGLEMLDLILHSVTFEIDDSGEIVIPMREGTPFDEKYDSVRLQAENMVPLLMGLAIVGCDFKSNEEAARADFEKVSGVDMSEMSYKDLSISFMQGMMAMYRMKKQNMKEILAEAMAGGEEGIRELVDLYFNGPAASESVDILTKLSRGCARDAASTIIHGARPGDPRIFKNVGEAIQAQKEVWAESSPLE